MTQRIPEDVLLWCEESMPALLHSFVAQASERKLPDAPMEVGESVEHESGGEDSSLSAEPPTVGARWFASCSPLFDESGLGTERGWELCSFVSRDDEMLERWYVTRNEELRVGVAGQIAAGPLEFFVHLSAARLGGFDRGLLPALDGENLALGILELALAGQPITLTVLSPA